MTLHACNVISRIPVFVCFRRQIRPNEHPTERVRRVVSGSFEAMKAGGNESSNGEMN